MGRMGIYLDNLANQVIHKETVSNANVTRQCGHAFISGKHKQVCNFAEKELRNLRVRFDHQSLGEISNVFEEQRGTGKKKVHIRS